MTVKQLARIKAIPVFGQYLYEALASVQSGMTNFEQQGNLNASGQPLAPPAPNALTATSGNGFVSVAIQDQNPGLRRGIQYYLDHADNPAFVNAQTIHLGDARNHTMFVGSATRYLRAYSAYASSPASPHVYHGSQAQPIAVSGGGSIGAPPYLPSQGTGTGAAGQGGVGPGPVPERSAAGGGADWTLQRATGEVSASQSLALPNQGPAIGGPSGGGGGGGGGTGTVTSVGLTVPSGFTVSGSPVTTAGNLAVTGILNKSAGGTGTATPNLIAGSNVAISGTWPNQTISVTGGGGGSLINSGELIAQVAPPALASWTQLNTPTSASDVTGIGVLLNTAAVGINVKGLLIAAPGVPFTVTIRIVGQLVGANFAQFGLCLAAGNTASDKLVNFGYTINSAPRHEIAYYTNATSYSSSPLSPSVLYTARYVNGYLRVQDDGVNLLFSTSDTGIPGTFVQIFSASRTAWLPSGPAYIGFETNEYNSGWPVTAVLTHWVVTTP